MAFSYAPLWKLLIDKGTNKSTLRVELRLSPNTVSRMSKGEYVSMEILDRLCKHLDCQLEDIVKYVPDKEK